MGFFLYIQERQCNGFRSRHCIVDDSKISDNLQAKGKRIFPTRFSSPHGFSFSFPSAHKFSQFCLQYELTPQPSFLSRLARPMMQSSSLAKPRMTSSAKMRQVGAPQAPQSRPGSRSARAVSRSIFPWPSQNQGQGAEPVLPGGT